MRYFKIEYGFDTDDFIPIDETELEKAIYAHMTGAKAAFQNGSVSGDKIIAIREDWHRARGWSYGYRLGADDFNELTDSGTYRAYKGAIAAAKEKVTYCIQSDRLDLIGKNVPLWEIVPANKPPQLHE